MFDLRTAPPALSLPFVIRALRVALGAWTARGFLAVTLALLVHRRLGEICQRFERLAQRFAAGLALRRLRGAPSRGGDAADAATADDARVGGGRAGAGRVWPGAFFWLVRAAGWEAAGFAGQVRVILEQPDMIALLRAAPQAGRLLVPVCRMLGLETSLLRPPPEQNREREAEQKTCSAAPLAPVSPPRVRRRKPDLGPVALPRGVMAAVRKSVVREA